MLKMKDILFRGFYSMKISKSFLTKEKKYFFFCFKNIFALYYVVHVRKTGTDKVFSGAHKFHKFIGIL